MQNNFSLEELLDEEKQNVSLPFAPSAPAKPIDPAIIQMFQKQGRLPAASPVEAEESIAPIEPVAKPPSDYDKFKSDYGADKLKAAQDEGESRKSGLGWAQFAAGVGDSLAGRSPSDSAKNFDNIRKGIDDSTVGAFEKRRDASVKDISNKKSMDEQDPKSRASVSYRQMMEAKFPDVVKAYGDNWQYVTSGDQDKIFNPMKFKADIDLRREEAQGRREDRSETRYFRQEAAKDKAKERQLKGAELSSAQSKQLGLYKSGKTADEQYAKAIGDGKDFDPTASGQWIDNSESWAPNFLKNDKAIESQAAKESWVESFLRDASGAAIPPSERGAYAKVFFPAPGDTKVAVENKKQLREQKMDNSLAAAGHSGGGTSNELNELRAGSSENKEPSGEVERTYKGKIAIYDAKTKQFLRYK